MVLQLVSLPLLSFIPRALRVLRVLPITDHVSVEAGSRRCVAECPACGSASQRIHSNYTRKLRDLPSHGRTVMIHVAARRFRCLNAACARKTFAERLDDALVSARRTKRLGDLQRYLGLALGGELVTLGFVGRPGTVRSARDDGVKANLRPRERRHMSSQANPRLPARLHAS